MHSSDAELHENLSTISWRLVGKWANDFSWRKRHFHKFRKDMLRAECFC